MECYAFSFRGHGKSPTDRPINKLRIRHYVEDLKTVIDNIGKSPIIIAHSMGGLVTQKYLEEHDCAGAVLMASVPLSGVLRISTKINLTRAYGLPSILSANLYRLVNTKNKAKWALFSDDIPERLLKNYTSQLGKESFRAFLDMLFPSVKINPQLKAPMLVLAGDRDQLFTINENKKTAQGYNASLQIIKEMAHDMMLEKNHSKAAEAIMAWIEKNFIS